MAVSNSDLRAVLDFVNAAREYPDPASFRTGILPALRKLVDCDVIGYNEVDLEHGTILVLDDPVGALPTEVVPRLVDLAHEHPVLVRNRGGDLSPYAISDFLSARSFHRLSLYGDLYRHLAAEDQLSFGLPGPVTIGIAFNRSSRSFSLRDRAVIELLQPHLTRAWSDVRERERTTVLVEALEHGIEDLAGAVVLVDRRRRIEQTSDLARDLLEAYGSSNGRLPAALSEQLGGGVAPCSVDLKGPRGILRVRALPRPAGAGGWTLMLSERRSRSPLATDLRALGLSPREAQVLRLVAIGEGNDAIAADLGIAKATVRKHLERIFLKLGVHSRAEAVTVALGFRPD